MPKQVLSVGQCGPDTMTLRRYLETHFKAQMLTSDIWSDTEQALRQNEVDLVLINRKLDADYTDGMEILRKIKSDESLRHLPVMIVTNYPEHQEAAVAAGGEYGFGKLQYDQPETKERLAAFLSE